MKNRKTRKYTIAFAIAALVTGCFQLTNTWIQPARAHLPDGSVRFIAYSLGGIIPGQIIRISVGAHAARGSTSIAFQTKFFDESGNLAFESERTPVPAGGFGKNDVLYGALGMDSEASTGRKQYRMEVLFEGRIISASDVFVNAETLDEGTGKTTIDLDIGVLEVAQNTSL